MHEVQTLEELPFVAGDAALDFVNTAEQRDHPEAGDVLLTPADLRRWGQRYGLLARSTPLDADAAGELERTIAARELLYGIFFAHVHGEGPAPRELRQLGQLAAEAYAAARLERGSDGSAQWTWPRAKLSSVRHVAVTSAVALLAAETRARIKQCPGDHCGWYFLDATKRGNRRWCLMSECGQEAKDARRRDRRRRAQARSLSAPDRGSEP